MSRICREEYDIPTVYKYDPIHNIPSSFDDFGRENQPCINLQKEYPENFGHGVRSDRSESERDYPDPRGNQLWTKLNSNKTDIKDKWDKFYGKKHKEDCPDSQEFDYINTEIFPSLIPAVVDCLKLASEKNILRQFRFGMDAVDFIAEHVYNRNPEYPTRIKENKDLFDIDKFLDIATENRKEAIPKSWKWTRQEAAITIQKNVRGWLARKPENIQFLRKFWKDLASPLARENTWTLFQGNTKALVELYPDIKLEHERRAGLTYENVFKRKQTMWEEDQKKREIEERIRTYLQKSKSIIPSKMENKLQQKV